MDERSASKKRGKCKQGARRIQRWSESEGSASKGRGIGSIVFFIIPSAVIADSGCGAAVGSGLT
jgi:hypothetical protein